MTRAPLLPLLLLAACASDRAASVAAPAAPADDRLASYYPLALGNTWTYETRFGPRVERNTVSIVGRDGPFFRDDAPHPSRLAFDDEGLRDGSRYLIRRPLRPGAAWQSIVDVGKTNRFEILETAATVRVPAGTFRDVLVIKAIDDGVGGGGELELLYAYAPGVGLVRLATTMVIAGRERIPQMTIELVSYRLQQD